MGARLLADKATSIDGMESSDRKLCMPENLWEFRGLKASLSFWQQVSLHWSDIRVIALCDFCYEVPHRLFFAEVLVTCLLWPLERTPIGDGVLFKWTPAMDEFPRSTGGF